VSPPWCCLAHVEETGKDRIKIDPQTSADFGPYGGKTESKIVNSLAHLGKTGRDLETALRDLIIPVKGIYFDQIVAGTKPHEFRLHTPHWAKRLEGRTYRHVVMTRGYPKGGGVEGVTRLTRMWRGYDLRTIQHEHFGADPVAVFAIDVSKAAV
jgi:hypothetical protein